MARKKRETEAESELLGWRAAYVATSDPPHLAMEGPIEGRPDWRLALKYYGVDDRVILAEVKVFPAADRLAWISQHDTFPDDAPIQLNVGQWSENAYGNVLHGMDSIPARLLHEIRLGDLNEKVRVTLAEHSGITLPLKDGSAVTVGELWRDYLAGERAKPKRFGRSDTFYAIWAHRYVEMTGRTRVNQELAEKFKSEEEGLTASKVASYIRVAHDRCLYVSNGQGKAGGSLTKTAIDLLAALDEENGAKS
jgi:hypothetical protein